MSHRKEKILKGGAREIIAHVIQECDREAANKAFTLPLIAKTKRAAMYTGVSRTTIIRIKQEDNERNMKNPKDSLKSPGKKRSRPNIVDKIDDYHFQIIRRTIEDFYLLHNQAPSVRSLWQKINVRFDFKWGRTSLNHVLTSNGFVFRIYGNKRKLLMERPENVHWRLNYLKAIRKYRSENKNIIYLDETWIDNNMPIERCWQSDEHTISGVMGGIRSAGRLILVHAGGADGFVKGAELVFQSGLSVEDHMGQIDYQNFKKWLHDKLFPNILPGSVIVFDNAPYHCEPSDIPTEYSTKEEMVNWLKQNNIPHEPSARKAELMEIINSHKPTKQSYKIDEMIKSHGHIPLRLPPFVCDLNAIEPAWEGVKSYLREHNTTRDLCTEDLIKLTYDAISSITKENWDGYIKLVQAAENNYLEKDARIENIIDEIITNLESGKNDNYTDGLFSSSEDSDLEDLSS